MSEASIAYTRRPTSSTVYYKRCIFGIETNTAIGDLAVQLMIATLGNLPERVSLELSQEYAVLVCSMSGASWNRESGN
ncbi:hypothetical protein DL89DRAFT_268582 [Linderina pennispora]|uniref:Uncharacterized protein n=1 Tax=Linderina pennispora TaxID=61395 RepID=A0A1Y1W610_9FUNG|nr:uncharacterized protein DL89DRAFT_268582 [Linderina pennispora]ORX68805.1 hypothetical protein DL89DRAFT_268582 [Linderina pennispora]